MIYHQTQLLLRFVYIIIIYKNQELIFFKIIIYFFDKNVDIIIAYVILSRIRNYNNFIIEKSIFYNVFFIFIFFKIRFRLNNEYQR